MFISLKKQKTVLSHLNCQKKNLQVNYVLSVILIPVIIIKTGCILQSADVEFFVFDQIGKMPCPWVAFCEQKLHGGD